MTSALTLLHTLPSESYAVYLLAETFPTDVIATPDPDPSYATTLAGAHFRPIPAVSPQLKHEAQLAKKTYETWKRVARDAPEMGVRMCEGIEFIDAGAPALRDYQALEREYVGQEGFRLIDMRDVKGPGGPQKKEGSEMLGASIPDGTAFGCRYDTYTIDTEICAVHLLRRFRINGGSVIRKRLRKIEEAFEAIPADKRAGNIPLVINCSGMGFDDPSTFVIRGQTCLVRNVLPDDEFKTITRQLRDGSWSFIIPRPLLGGTIVGGTKQPNDWSCNPDPQVREQLLQNAAELCPSLLGRNKKWDVVRDIVGRRPARKGGIRLELETLVDEYNSSKNNGDLETAQGKSVIHAYGVGGRGWELSWGIAEEVVKMATDCLGEDRLKSIRSDYGKHRL